MTGPDPRTWVREDVLTFLRWCEREFDLPNLEMDKFQMNGESASTQFRAPCDFLLLTDHQMFYILFFFK